MGQLSFQSQGLDTFKECINRMSLSGILHGIVFFSQLGSSQIRFDFRIRSALSQRDNNDWCWPDFLREVLYRKINTKGLSSFRPNRPTRVDEYSSRNGKFITVFSVFSRGLKSGCVEAFLRKSLTTLAWSRRQT